MLIGQVYWRLWARHRHAFTILLPVLVIGLCTRAQAQPLSRWAVVVDPSLEAGHFGELLPTAIAERSKVELVERDQIAAALKELELSTLLGDENPAERLKLGRLVKADGMVLLRLESSGDQRIVVLTVCDCRWGARLLSDRLSLTDIGVEQLVSDIASYVDVTMNRFPAGVERVVGVPYFFSRSLSTDYDHWQTQLACILENALTAHTGVAVLETEEAAAIRREMTIGDSAPLDRHLPMMIDADYKVETTGDGQSISLTLGILDAAGNRKKLEHQASRYAGAAAWLRDSAARDILGVAPGQPSIPVIDQVRLLDKRAANFARLGSFEQAAALHEAALLLDPSDGAHGLAAIRCYSDGVRMRPALSWTDHFRSQPPAETVLAEWRKRVGRWRRALDLLGELIDQKMVTQAQALAAHSQMDRAMKEFTGMLPGPGPRDANPWTEAVTNAVDEELRSVTESSTKRLERSIPRLLQLEIGEEQREKWYAPDGSVRTHGGIRVGLAELARRQQQALSLLLDPPVYDRDRIYPQPLTRVRLDRYLAVLGSVGALPVEAPDVLSTITETTLALDRKRDYTNDEFRSFLDKLRITPGPLNPFYSDFGVILFDHYLAAADQRSSAERAIADLTELRAAIEASGLLPSSNRFFDTIGVTLGRIAHGMRRGAPLASAPVAPAEDPESAEPDNPNAPDVEVEAHESPAVPPLPHEIVHFQVRRKGGRIESYASRKWAEEPGYVTTGGYPVWVAHCGDLADVFVNNWSVLLHREPGIVDEVLLDHEAKFCGAVWDGQFVWIPSRNRGITVISPKGAILGQFTRADGLPEHDSGLKIARTGSGEVLAVGSFGGKPRAWIGTIKFDGTKFSLRVFHEAKNQYPNNELAARIPTDPELGFEVCCIESRRDALGDGRPIYYVHRKRCDACKLEVDIGSMSVRVVDLDELSRTPGDDLGHYNFLRNGDSLRILPEGLIRVTQFNRVLEDGLSKQWLGRDPAIRLAGSHFEWNGALYFPGRHFVRLPQDSLTPTIVGGDPFPKELDSSGLKHGYFVSTLLGPLAVTAEGRFYRVDLGDDSAPIGDLPAFVRVRSKQSQAPLQGARVVFSRRGGEDEAVADDEGQVPVPTIRGQRVGITAFSSGYVSRHVVVPGGSVAMDSNRVFAIELEPSLSIGGVIRDANDRPVAGASVTLNSTQAREAWGDAISSPAYTNAEGVWQMTLAPHDLSRTKLVARVSDRQGTQREYGTMGERTIEQLRARTLVWKLDSALEAKGSRVVAQDGAPIAGVRVRALLQAVSGLSELWEGMTDSKGEFAVPTEVGKTARLVFTKVGFAPEVLSVSDTTDGSSVVLRKGRRLRGRVTDENGQPLPSVEVANGTSGTAERTWAALTDSSGTFEWADAPEKGVFLVAAKTGFETSKEHSIDAATGEAVIRLKTITAVDLDCAVLDGETSESVRLFDVQFGRASHLETIIAKEKEGYVQKERFADGRLRKRIQATSDSAFRITAEGYAPIVMLVPPDGRLSEIRMHRSSGIAGVIVGKDGMPLANAQVVLCKHAGAMPSLRDDRLSTNSSMVTVATDAHGRFRFPPQSGSFKFVIRHDAGYIELGPISALESPTITLQPWARVSGICRVGARDGAGEEIRWEVPREPGPWKNWSVQKGGKTQADAEGRFAFDHIPAGEITISRLVKLPQGATSSTQHSQNSQSLTLTPGEVENVEINPAGGRITGNIVLPAGAGYEIDRIRLRGRIQGVPPNRRPPNWGSMSGEEQQAWTKANSTPELRAARKAITSLSAPLEFRPDGSFVITDAAPSLYRLSIEASGEGMPGQLMLTTYDFDATKLGNEPLDVGTIELGSTREFPWRQNAAAPPPKEPSPDGAYLRPIQIGLVGLIVVGGIVAVVHRRATARTTASGSRQLRG